MSEFNNLARLQTKLGPLHLSLNKFVAFCCVLLSVFSASKAQQCSLPSRLFQPVADESPFQQLGGAVDVHNGYMVAGARDNCSLQVYSGLAFVYKLGADHKWTKIAELAPSDPGKYVAFGSNVEIHDNMIVVSGREFSPDGQTRGKLYVFTKSPGDEWTSSTEDYIIAKPFGGTFTPTGFGEFQLLQNEMVVVAGNDGTQFVEVYTRSAGSLTLTQSFEVPHNASGNPTFSWNLAVGNDFIAISTEQITLSDMSSGAVFVYGKSGGVYNTTPAILKSDQQTSQNWMGIGVAIAAYQETIYVQGLYYTGSNYNQTYYVFEKPAGGWVNATAAQFIQGPGSVFYDIEMVANDNYIFATGPGYKSVVGFKKNGANWDSNAQPIVLDDMPNDKVSVAYELEMTDNHLVVGCVPQFTSSGTSDEFIANYYSASGSWETPGLASNQLIREKEVNATDDSFGETFGVHGNFLAVAASGDDSKGIEAGAVYMYDITKNSAQPDQKIYMPEDENYSNFGETIAVGENIMFIGAPYKDSLSSTGTPVYYSIGKVYVYRLTASGWKYSSQIIAPQIKSQVCFGRKVVWSRGYCAVTEFYGGSSESIGRVHIYKENVTTGKFDYLATLDPSTHLRSDFFGQTMIMNDTLMVIGTGNAAVNSSYRMSVYVFRKKGEWKAATEDARLYSTTSGWSDRYGASISMFGDYIVIGAPYSPGFDPRPMPRNYDITGAAYIYKKPPGGWKGQITEIAKLMPSDPVELGTFGTSVAIDHNDIFIGSPNRFAFYNRSDHLTNNDPKLIPGRVYHYKKAPGADWTSSNQETRQILSFEPDVIDGYGATMYVSDRYLYVGAMYDNTSSGFRTGSVQTLMQLPAIDDPPNFCINQPAVLFKAFPKGGVWSGVGMNPTTGLYTPSVPGIHTITYERDGCQTSVDVEVSNIQLVIKNQSPANQTKCIGEEIPITFDTDENISGYKWFFRSVGSDEYVKYDSMKAAIVTDTPGYYQVQVPRDVCPLHTQEFAIADDNPVIITIDEVESACNDDKIQFTAEPSVGKWTGTNVTPAGIFNPSQLADGKYKQIYEIVTSLGCRWKDSVEVIVDRLRQPELQASGEEICENRPVALTLTNVRDDTSIKWFDPEGNEITGQTSLVLQATKAGSYIAQVSKGNCTLDAQSDKLTAIADSLYVPNVFSPNGDTANDYFEVRATGIDNFYLVLFNRYGQPLFETNELNFKWPAEDVPSGVYFWKVNYRSCANFGKEARGWVHVVK